MYANLPRHALYLFFFLNFRLQLKFKNWHRSHPLMWLQEGQCGDIVLHRALQCSEVFTLIFADIELDLFR